MPRRSRAPARTMPAQTRHLYTHGQLTPDDARALGVHVMRCTRCQGETTLMCPFAPVPEAALAREGCREEADDVHRPQ